MAPHLEPGDTQGRSTVESVQKLAEAAKEASIRTAALDTETKNDALRAVSETLRAAADSIFAENRKDLDKAEENAVPAPLLKRLKFDRSKLDGVCEGINSVISLDDPVGTTLSARALDEGLELYQVTCPIGVIGMVFESRPDALVQISSLALKSGNAVILKGGSEASHTNRILASILSETSVSAGMPAGWISLVESRADVAAMLALDDCIDLMIPRGSNEFVRYIMDNTRIPVLGHADGICHVYLHEDADTAMAVDITVDSKTQYVAVCNAAETLLVHETAASRLIPPVVGALKDAGVTVKGCTRTAEYADVVAAEETDWSTEYLDYVISVKVVSSLDGAITHINTYGSGHTDTIVTEDEAAARRFMTRVDSAGVFWNAGTRFADGYRYGLGAEVGISTNKIHARGPVGMEGLMIYKWLLKGKGQTVAMYSGDGARRYLHTPLELRSPFGSTRTR
jgi:glutamate-5-semialdehyde dehydrogenase